MFGLIVEYQNSGLSARAFSEEKGLKPSTFNYWVRKKKQESRTGGFVKLNTRIPSSNNSLDLLYPNGVRIQMASPDLSLIAELLKLY